MEAAPALGWPGQVHAMGALQVGLHAAPVLPRLLNCSSLVAAGVPRKPGMTRDDLFNINAGQWWQAIYHCLFLHLHLLLSC